MGLPQALALAERGLRVFPLAKNSKLPMFKAWHEDATNDVFGVIEQFTSIRARDGSRYPAGQDMDYNVGVLTDGMLVVDVDVKNGKNGWENFLSHDPDLHTFTVETPSKGRHYYYNTLGTSWSNSASSKLGDGVDTRSHHGYVVGPGSVVDGKAYEIIHDVPHAPVPKNIISKLDTPRVRKTVDVEFDAVDSPSSIAYVTRMAQEASPACSGEQSHRAYELACRMRDHGVSDLMATAIMAEQWGPRCEPPLSYEDLEVRVQNAYQYAKGVLGAESAAFTFSAVDLDVFRQKETAPGEGSPDAVDANKQESLKNTHAEDEPHTEQKVGFSFGNMTPREKLTPRPWIVKDLLLSGDVTTMAAEGSAGKTTFLLNVAVHLAAGSEDILGYTNQFAGQSVKSIIHSAEDDIVELSRRIEGVCIEHDLDPKDIAPHIALSSGKDRDMKFALLDQTGNPSTGKYAIDQIITLTNEGGVGLIGLDPLANLHALNENDSVQMTYLMSVFNQLAKNTGASVLLMHHTHKSADGSVASSRGSSAIMNSSRIGLVLNRVNDKDAAEHGIPARDIPRVTWIGEGKSNVSERRGHRRWYLMKSIKLWTEDSVGVPVRYNERAAQGNTDARIVNIIKDYIVSSASSSISMRDAVNHLRNTSGEDIFLKCSTGDAENLLRQIIRRVPNILEVTAANKVQLSGVGSDNVVAFHAPMRPKI